MPLVFFKSPESTWAWRSCAGILARTDAAVRNAFVLNSDARSRSSRYAISLRASTGSTCQLSRVGHDLPIKRGADAGRARVTTQMERPHPSNHRKCALCWPCRVLLLRRRTAMCVSKEKFTTLRISGPAARRVANFSVVSRDPKLAHGRGSRRGRDGVDPSGASWNRTSRGDRATPSNRAVLGKPSRLGAASL